MREGETGRRVELLEEVGQRAAVVVWEKFAELTEEEIAQCAAQVGIGAVGCADPSNPMVRDHVFDPDRMVSLQGDATGVHRRDASPASGPSAAGRSSGHP
ncbi:arginine--tRNA ligase [Streptomyces alkaliphilus]|uniref:Arginine--tRNA ligase n=1 Tax=Streptomyces alkaliphilus TaxID=1472722 RepID=A0A7W3T9K5_9ACTN|nr:arginine--tRNA ligase [Streptomyces alkaliphilus]MBB0242738.1 arginine--tRNA ligase [Streptomyces alkaliphilus]